MMFYLQKDPDEEFNGIFHSTFSTARYNNHEARPGIRVSSLEDNWLLHVRFDLDSEIAEADRVELEISDYPARIIRDFRIKIK